MLKIDCLLINTEVAETVKKLIGYLGHKGIADDTDVSFKSMYNKLRKSGVEIDATTAAHIYENELPLEDSRFTPAEELKYHTGNWLDKIVRDITLQKPKEEEEEKEIGDLSPSQAFVKVLADAFSNNVKGDYTTKSILKTLEDVYRSWAINQLGELPNEEVSDERSTAEIVQKAMDNKMLGFRNLKDGTINGLKKIHDEVRAKIKELTAHMVETGDYDKIEQWNNYAKALEDASYSLMFSTKEGQQILHDSLRDAGFTKLTKSGEEVKDWQKMAGNINSYEQLRKNVVDSMVKSGFDEETGHRVADALSKEFRDIRGKILEVAENIRQKAADSWTEAARNPAARETIPDMVARMNWEWANYKKLKNDPTAPLRFSLNDSKRIIGDALRNSEEYGMDWGAGERAVDWAKMAELNPDAQTLYELVRQRLLSEGVDSKDAEETASAVIRDYYDVLADDIKPNAKRLLDTRTSALDREQANPKSDIQRLAELHDLGIFEGAHDRLLAHTLGIDEEDIKAIAGIKVYAQKLSKLRQIMEGNDFLAPTIVASLNREIHKIIAPLISNKGKVMKIVSAINKIYQVDNSMLIATHGNILENHLSGATELLTTNLSMRLKLGSELGGFKAQDLKLMADMYGYVAHGGVEFGLAPHQVGGSKERLSDKYTFDEMKGADWSKPKTWAKGVAAAVFSIPRTFLSGADSAVKTGLMNAHIKGAVVDSIIKGSGGSIGMDKAVQMYNDAIYGNGQLDIARAKAEDLYKKIGLNYVSQKELNITANEILRENLIQNRLITADELKDVMENSFHQAGLGMGHESNNPISKMYQHFKQAGNRDEQQALNDKDYTKAGWVRAKNTLLYDVVLRFVASRFNWAWIRAEQAGGGVLTGLWHYGATNIKYRNTDIFDAEKMKEEAVEYAKARQKIARGLVGMSLSAFGYLATKAIAKGLYPDEEDPTEAMFDKFNYFQKALYLKVSPIWMLQSYEYNEGKSGSTSDRALHALGKDFINLTNIGDSHDPDVEIAEAIKKLGNKSEKIRNLGYGELGKAIGNYAPHVPLLRQGENVMEFTKWIEGKEGKPMPPFPDNFEKGLFYGGIIQDALGLIPDEELPEKFQGWGKNAPPPPVKMSAKMKALIED